MRSRVSWTILTCVFVGMVAAAGGILLGKSRGLPFVELVGEYSIGIYAGPSPIDLDPHESVRNPVITAADVTDVDAGFVADPFMIRRDGRWFMFFEVLNQADGKGDIGMATSDDALEWTYQSIVLDEPFHLSYPQIIRSEGEIYMVPESGEDYTVRLYRARDFPFVWELDRVLLRGNYADPTITMADGHWWMFVSDRDDVLLAFYADDLRGPWMAHAQNPLLVGTPSEARSAGTPVRWGQSLVRFVQETVPIYGYAVRAFAVTDLSPETFAQESLQEAYVVGPEGKNWSAERMHHVDAHQTSLDRWIAAVDGVGRRIEFGWRH